MCVPKFHAQSIKYLRRLDQRCEATDFLFPSLDVCMYVDDLFNVIFQNKSHSPLLYLSRGRHFSKINVFIQ